MSKKKYISLTKCKQSISFLKNGIACLIQFKGHSQPSFTTECEEEQKAIEGSRAFKRGVIALISPPEEDSGGDVEITIEGISTAAAACEYMHEHYDIPKTKLKSKGAIRALAKEHGIVFVDLK